MNSITLIATVFVAFAVTSAIGIPLIPFLRRIKFGQTILEIGPRWHKNKQGTPTMGGFMFIVGIVAAVAVGFAMLAMSNTTVQGVVFDPRATMRTFSGLVFALACAAIGFLDDYIKVSKKHNEGLTARQKYLIQLIVCVCYLAMLYLAGDTSGVVTIPFIGQLDLGLWYYPLAVILITGFVNAVNLTDGIDGLASSVTFVFALVMLVIAGMMRGFAQSSIMAAALAGGCLGFLVWNFYPAKVFMGDTGSMFLGGLVVALSFDVGLPLLLVLTGVIYWAEAFSVILQVISFKSTGKRIFKMSPIHHHFEMSGWSEVKIVMVFSLIALIGGILAILSVRTM